MPIPPPPAAAERFTALLHQMSLAVASRTGWALTLQIIAHIITRISGIRQRFADLAARIAAGTYRPRRPATTPRACPGRLPPANKLPNRFGWLRPMIAETPAFAGQFDGLLHDPEFLALMAAAPAAMRRPIRSICWMLGVSPPPILALPPRPRPPVPPADPPARPGKNWPHDPRPRDRLGFYQGPPPLPSSANPLRTGRRNSG